MLDMEQKDSGPLIISANSTVWNIILRCATCCRLRRKWGFPKITNLPKKKKDAWKQVHSPTQESICLDQS